MNAKGKAARAAAILAMAAAVLAAGCGVSKSKYLEVSTSAEQLTAKNQALQQSLDSANTKSAQLEKDLAATQAATQASITELKAELESTKQATVSMQSTYEGLVGQLKSEVSNGSVTIQQMRDGIRVNLAQEILFKSGSANLDKTGKELLAKVAEELQGSTYEIQVIGHTDNQKIGPALAQRYPTNWELGSARASQITRLFMDAGIAESRMVAVSAADGRPRADNATEEGRAQNRRIEIRLRPIETTEAASN
jgi:chemotaxis protein MotB